MFAKSLPKDLGINGWFCFQRQMAQDLTFKLEYPFQRIIKMVILLTRNLLTSTRGKNFIKEIRWTGIKKNLILKNLGVSQMLRIIYNRQMKASSFLLITTFAISVSLMLSWHQCLLPPKYEHRIHCTTLLWQNSLPHTKHLLSCGTGIRGHFSFGIQTPE